jgi:hypothetical protein
MQLIHFPRSLTAVARLGLALVMVALTLLGSARSAAAATTPFITRTGSGFRFSSSNNTAVIWTVKAGTKEPIFDANANLVFPSGSNVVTVSSGSSALTSFDRFIGGLIPNTTYFYILRAGSAESKGKLGTTLQRNMTIDFNTYTITNDSDDFGSGELLYHFQVNGVHRSELDFFNFADNTGETFVLSRKAFLTNGPARVPLKVEVQDDDCAFSTCVRPADFTSGSDADNDWATASASVSGVSDESSPVTKIVPMSVNGAVGFKVTVFVQVTYF